MPFSATTGESRISNNNSERIIENSNRLSIPGTGKNLRTFKEVRENNDKAVVVLHTFEEDTPFLNVRAKFPWMITFDALKRLKLSELNMLLQEDENNKVDFLIFANAYSARGFVPQMGIKRDQKGRVVELVETKSLVSDYIPKGSTTLFKLSKGHLDVMAKAVGRP